MRFRWLTLAMALGTGILCSAAHAASNTDYLAVRNGTTLTTLSDTQPINEQLSGHAGQTFEVQGVITGVFAGEANSGFLLRVDPQQTLILSSAKNDPDITVGKTVRVLARIPAQGMVLEAVSLTGQGVGLAQSDLANLRPDTDPTTDAATGVNIIPAGKSDDVQYYQIPVLRPESPANTSTGSTSNAPSTTNVPLSQQPDVVQKYSQQIQAVNCNVTDATAQKIAQCILVKSETYGVDPRLIFALVTQESRFNPNAVSHCGAQGLGQLMPGTAAKLGVHDAFDIEDNLDGTVRYISAELNQFGHLSLALAAYNAGPGNVTKYGGVPPFRETQNYVKRIWEHYAQLTGRDPKTGEYIANSN